MFEFAPLDPGDVFEIVRQPSQRFTLGMESEISREDAEILAAGPVAWSCRCDGRLFACFGVAEQFEAVQGLGWALLAKGIGGDHLAFTRFVRARVAACPLARIEALARAPDLERVLEIYSDLDSAEIVELAMMRPTPEIRWAMLIGFKPAHVLRCYGNHAESYMLMERLRPPLLLTQEAA